MNTVNTRFALCLTAVLAVPALIAPSAEARSSQAFILRLGESSYATNVDLDDLLRLRVRWPQDFLWFRRDRRTYLVTDAATLATARQLVQPAHELGEEHHKVSQRLKPFEARENRLDREEERLDEREERLEDKRDRAADDERRRLQAERRALEAQRRQLQDDMREIEAEERRLDDREREVERAVDADLERLIDDVLRRGLARRLP